MNLQTLLAAALVCCNIATAVIQCSLPSQEGIVSLLNYTLTMHQGIPAASLVELGIENSTYTCLAAGDTLHKYRSFSVVVQYSKAPGLMAEYAQFQSECAAGLEWEVDSGEYETVDESYLDTPLRVDCLLCGFDSVDLSNCFLECSSNCKSSGKCVNGKTDCCPVYDNMVCADECPVNMIPDENDLYQCVCNSSCPAGYQHLSSCSECLLADICQAEEPCDNEGVCLLDTPPYEYHCECTDDYNGTNCTECIVQCDPGHALTDYCECELTDICASLGLDLCHNGGTCVLGSTPDNYTCDCINSYDPFSNCTECLLSCGAGYIVDSDCFQCTLVNICESTVPCQNGGTCVLESAPDNYTCDCINSYDPFSNCTECLLSCGAGYIVDSNCFQCTLVNICESTVPCQNGGTCVLESTPDNYTCDCINSYDPFSNCTECLLSCGAGYVVDSDCFQCTLVNICESAVPCQNGGTCVLGSQPDQFSCSCRNGYEPGSNCTKCGLHCPIGYHPSSDCSHCVLADICAANGDSLCANGGSCILVAPPDQHTCDCLYNYTGDNCTVCNASCISANLTLNLTSCECDPVVVSNNDVDVCETEAPCLNNATCVPGSFPYQYECECGVNYEGINCTTTITETFSSTVGYEGSSVKWWWAFIPVLCVLPVVVASVCLLTVHLLSSKKKNNEITPL